MSRVDIVDGVDAIDDVDAFSFETRYVAEFIEEFGAEFHPPDLIPAIACEETSFA